MPQASSRTKYSRLCYHPRPAEANRREAKDHNQDSEGHRWRRLPGRSCPSRPPRDQTARKLTIF